MHIRQYDLVLSQAQFLYNYIVSHIIGKCPFEVVYGQHPLSLLDLSQLTTLQEYNSNDDGYDKQIKKLHKDVRQKISRQNTQYQN